LASIEPRGRRALKVALARVGLLPVLKRAREIAWTARFYRANRTFLKGGIPDGLPVPPAKLRILVAASPDIAWFLEGGRRGAESVRAILEANGVDFGSTGPILDFGCGCGRVLRNFGSAGVEAFGSDLNPRLIGWCRRNLPFGGFETNGIAPPLAFADGQFGLVYSLSVFTHLPESLQGPWWEEMARVLRPGGHLVFSTHGARYAAELTEEERASFDAGRLVVRRDDLPGSNTCGAYHPEAYVRTHLPASLKVVAHLPEGALGNPFQDLWLARRV